MTPEPYGVPDLTHCGYCLGWQRAELWRRIELVGDDDGGVTLRCRECGYRGQDLASLGIYDPPDGVDRVGSVADLLAAGEQHVISKHP